jgi:Family of unknown function (DUF6404)
MPTNIVWFERLAYASLGLGLLDLALDFRNLSRLSPAINLIGTLVLTLGVIALLIWLVARRRQGWARWAFLVLYLFGLPFFFMNLMQQSLLSVPISLLQVVLQGVALFFVFTGDAKTWFAQPQSVSLLDMPMPKSIERFEQLGYAGLILAIVATLFDLVEAARAPQSSIIKALAGLLEVVVIVIGWLLIWLVARRRQGWARWVFLVFSLIVLAHVVLTLGRAPVWVSGLNGLQVVAWLGGISLALMDEARPWFQTMPLPAAAEKPKMRLRVPAGQRIVVEPEEATHRKKVEGHIAEVGRLGMPSYVAAPPPFELLWSAGLEIPPPLFLGFLPLMAIAAVPAAIVSLLPIALLVRPAVALVLAVWCGLIFGAIVAAYYRRKARDLALPVWEHYLPILPT